MCAKKLSKRMNALKSVTEGFKKMTLNECIAFITSKYKNEFAAKFDETVDCIISLGVDPKKSDQVVRGVVPMPAGIGKNVKVLAFVEDENIELAISSGADLAGNTSIISGIKDGSISLDFDFCIASINMMPQVTSLSKILGPKGLMPNPKFGTVGNDIKDMIKNTKSGRVEFRVDKGGIIHAPVGKLSFSVDNLLKNVIALYSVVLSLKPASAKGVYVNSLYISTTQGPSLEATLDSIL